MYRIICLVLCCLGILPTAQAKTCNTLASFTWLLGSWHSDSNTTRISESWKQISSNTFEGAGNTYSVEKGRMVSSETLRLLEMSGEVFYIAKVASNELPVAFKLSHCTAKTATFENPQHDFPKKLSYHLTSDNTITVFVSGEDGNGFSIKFINENDAQKGH